MANTAGIPLTNSSRIFLSRGFSARIAMWVSDGIFSGVERPVRIYLELDRRALRKLVVYTVSVCCRKELARMVVVTEGYALPGQTGDKLVYRNNECVQFLGRRQIGAGNYIVFVSYGFMEGDRAVESVPQILP